MPRAIAPTGCVPGLGKLHCLIRVVAQEGEAAVVIRPIGQSRHFGRQGQSFQAWRVGNARRFRDRFAQKPKGSASSTSQPKAQEKEG